MDQPERSATDPIGGGEFPSAADYITAIENGKTCLLDPGLRDGRPIRGSDGELLLYSGGFAKVFVIESEGTTYAVRCWTSDIGNAAVRYRAVDRYLKQIRSDYFVNFEYVERGIRWAGASYPIVKMEWAGGTPLKEFVAAHLHEPEVLVALAESFLSMAASLHGHRIAHGDLQSDNVRILDDGTSSPRLLLIDYDTVVVPDLLAVPVTNVGVPGFQHPARARATRATEQVDYFGELVIYLTLYALALEPGLWDEYRVSDREKELLFAGEDFRGPYPSPLFERLRNLPSGVGDLARVLWNACRCTDPGALIPVEVAAALCRVGDRTDPSFEQLLELKRLESWRDDWTSGPPAPRPDRSSTPAAVPGPGMGTSPGFSDWLGDAMQQAAPSPPPSASSPPPIPFGREDRLPGAARVLLTLGLVAAIVLGLIAAMSSR